MSDQPTTGNGPDEMPGLDESVDEPQRDARISEDETDDLPVTPPDMQPRASENLPEYEAGETESIEQRIVQEEPDPTTAYGAPEDEGGLEGEPRLGGDDPDSIPAAEDFVGEPEGEDDVVPVDRAVDAPAEEDAIQVEEDPDRL